MSVFCVDCEHHQLIGPGNHQCNTPQNIHVVTGVILTQSCDDMRSATGRCGPTGRLFVSKSIAMPPAPGTA